MGCKLDFTPHALRDLEGIVAFYTEKEPAVALRYADGIFGIADRLRQFPQSGRLVPEFLDDGIKTYRECIFEYFRIVYRIDDMDVIVVRVLDSRMLFPKYKIEGH